MSASPELNHAPVEFPVSPVLLALGWRQNEEQVLNTASPPEVDTEFDVGEYCRTPRSEDSKLPSVPPSCPPAPRKSRRVVHCRRKLRTELEFIVVGAKEMEQLFRLKDHRRFEARPNNAAKKRKRRQRSKQ